MTFVAAEKAAQPCPPRQRVAAHRRTNGTPAPGAAARHPHPETPGSAGRRAPAASHALVRRARSPAGG